MPLIKKSWRPPNFETPVSYFNDVFTPNDAFFVRYHLSNIPEVAAATWRLKVGGEAAGTPFELSLDQLKRDFEQVEVAAVCQCSGNRRGMFQPHVPGVEWGLGAMGNARWKGARLKDVLAKAALKKEAIEIVLDGADGGSFPGTPDFVKSIPVWKALDENALIAYEMNGAPLPHWNGFPARIVIPGWTATYWMKQVTSIMAVAKPFDGFWVKSAYRIPRGALSGDRPVREPGDRRQYADHRDGRQFADHECRQRTAGAVGPRIRGQGHRVGRRLRDRAGRSVRRPAGSRGARRRSAPTTAASRSVRGVLRRRRSTRAR